MASTKCLNAEGAVTMISIAILLIPIATALTCSYDEKPYITNMPFKEDKIYWNCIVDNNYNYSCFTTVNDTEGIIQVNPESSNKKLFGAVNEFFTNDDNLLMVYFTNKNILAGGEYNFIVNCLNDNGNLYTEEHLVSPVLRNLNPDRFVWMKGQTGYIIAVVFVLLLVAGLIYILIKT